jgi:hypothetical protein
MLEFFLARDGAADVAEVFKIHQAMDIVVRGMRSGDRFGVRGDSTAQVVGHADVEVTGAAGEDVDPEVVFALHLGRIAACRGRKQQISFGNDRKKSKSKSSLVGDRPNFSGVTVLVCRRGRRAAWKRIQ